MEEYDKISYEDIIAQLSQSLFDSSSIHHKSTMELIDEINKEVLKVNDLKQIKFANPEKLSSKFDYKGNSYEIIFVGRELILEEDNYSWIIYEYRNAGKGPRAQLSVYKNPPSNNSVKIHTTSKFGFKNEFKIAKSDLATPEWIYNKLIELMDDSLPF